MTSQLAACAIYRNEADYLAEWIEFHRLCGFELFFLYDNMSTDHHRDVLAPYVEEGIVVLHDWRLPPPSQIPAYEHCLREHRGDSRWIAFFDIDEFLFNPQRRPVPELLAGFERWPGVAVNLAQYGTSGYVEAPPGLVIENYVWRSDDPRGGRFVKSIVDPRRVARCEGAHHFTYIEGEAVDTSEQPLEEGFSREPSYSLLRVNHYYTRSRSEWMQKLARPRADTGELRRVPRVSIMGKRESKLNAKLDDSATIYAPAVRAALEELEGVSAGGR